MDVWSGNHPFFQGNQSTVLVDEGRVNRFNRRYAGGFLLSWPSLCLAQSVANSSGFASLTSWHMCRPGGLHGQGAPSRHRRRGKAQYEAYPDGQEASGQGQEEIDGENLPFVAHQEVLLPLEISFPVSTFQ